MTPMNVNGKRTTLNHRSNVTNGYPPTLPLHTRGGEPATA
jgi:hypothetical protein